MSFFTAKLSANQLQKVFLKLENCQITNTDKNVLCAYEYKGCRITIYRTYKILIQGKDYYNVAKELGFNALAKNEPIKICPAKKESLENYIGCDEVGVGDYFGGLVTCAVYVNSKSIKALKDLGVCDSKNLTDIQMHKIVSKIKKVVNYEVAEFSAEEYNDNIKQWGNTHIAKAILHNMAIKNLKQKVGRCPVVMDQFVAEKKYFEYFKKINVEPEIVDFFETKAENKYIGVAAASIIARVSFLDQIKKIKKELGLEIPLGASNPKIISVAQKIPKEKLIEFVKIDFATTKKLK